MPFDMLSITSKVFRQSLKMDAFGMIRVCLDVFGMFSITSKVFRQSLKLDAFSTRKATIPIKVGVLVDTATFCSVHMHVAGLMSTSYTCQS